MQTPNISPAPSRSESTSSDEAASRSFRLLALVSLCGAAGWLAFSPELVLAENPGPAAWALCIVLVAGCFLSLGFAALYAFGRKAFDWRLPGFWPSRAHFAAHLACVILVPGLLLAAGGEWLRQAWPAFLVLPIVFVLPIFVAIQKSHASSVITAFFIASGFWLLLALSAGVGVLAGWLPRSVESTRYAAAGLVLLFGGVFVNLIQGALFGWAAGDRATSPRTTHRVATTLILSNLCVAFLLHAALLGPREVIALFAAVYAGCMVWMAVGVWSISRESGRQTTTPAFRLMLTASWMVVPTVGIGVAALWGPDLGSALLGNSYVVCAVLGVLALFALGTFDLLTLDRSPRPQDPESPASLLAPHIQVAGYINAVVGVFLMVPGIAIASEQIVSLGAFFFLMGVIALVARIVLRIPTHPGTSPPLPCEISG